MSYNLRIYTAQKQNLKESLQLFNAEMINDSFVIQFKNHQIVINGEILVEDEDIPPELSSEIPGIKYLIECNLEPITCDEKLIKQVLKICKVIAKNGIGIIENPQTDEIIKPSGIKRVMKVEKTERIALLELSWWFNHENLLENDNMNVLLSEICRILPEALPRRYGLYEPPQEQFSTFDSFKDYLKKNIRDSIVWYPSRPVMDVNLRIPAVIGPTKSGYRFGHFSISIDASVMAMPGWKTLIRRLFKSVSEVLCPFYGDVYVLENYIYSRRFPYSDYLTEYHPISSWWWNGIPREFGLGMVIGNPLLNHVNIKGESIELKNGCKLISRIEDEKCNKLSVEDIEVPENLFQAPKRSKVISIGFNGVYPKLWPFIGPFDR